MPFSIKKSEKFDILGDKMGIDLPGSIFLVGHSEYPGNVIIMPWSALGACSTATIQNLNQMSAWPEEVWPEFCEFVKRLGHRGLDGAYKPQRLVFNTTTKYTDGWLNPYMKGCFKKLIESSKLLETFKNHSHTSEPNVLYMLDLNP